MPFQAAIKSGIIKPYGLLVRLRK